MKVYKVAYLGGDSETALALETALSEAGMKFIRAIGDQHGVKKVVEFNADVVLWNLGNNPDGAPIPMEQIREVGLTSNR